METTGTGSQLVHLRREDMLGLWVVRQGFARSSSQQDCPAPGLSNTILASLQDAKGALVAHLDKCPHAQLQHHRLLVGGKVPHILQNEEARPGSDKETIYVVSTCYREVKV